MLHAPLAAPSRRPVSTCLALALTGLLLTACGKTDNDADKDVPTAGTASPDQVVPAVKEVSSQLQDFIGVPGQATAAGPGVRECAGEDPDAYFRVHYPWSFLPTSKADIDTAMANLQVKLSTDGWVIKISYRDNSPNQNLNLVAENDARNVSAWIVAYSKRDTPSLGIDVASACYRAPEGQTADHF